MYGIYRDKHIMNMMMEKKDALKIIRELKLPVVNPLLVLVLTFCMYLCY